MKNKNQYHIWAHKNLAQTLYNLKNPTGKKIQVFAAEEVDVHENFDPNRIKNNNIDWVFGRATSNADSRYYQTGKVYLWWNFFLFFSMSEIDISNLNITNPQHKKLFITLNYRGHYHRCMMLDILYKKELEDYGFISWHNKELDSDYKFSSFTPKRIMLDKKFPKQRTQHILPQQYDKSLVNLISESDPNVIFVTEKTWHAIICEKCFLVQGAPGFHKFLKSKGFLLYDEIFDYSFDSVLDLETRTDMLLEEINKIKQKNYDQVFKKIKPKLKKNRQLAFNIIKNQTDVPEIAFGFKYYQDLIEDAQCRLDILE